MRSTLTPWMWLAATFMHLVVTMINSMGDNTGGQSEQQHLDSMDVAGSDIHTLSGHSAQ